MLQRVARVLRALPEQSGPKAHLKPTSAFVVRISAGRRAFLAALGGGSRLRAIKPVSSMTKLCPRATKPSADQGADEEQCNGHEPERDYGRVYAHRPSSTSGTCAGVEDANRRSALSHHRERARRPDRSLRMRPYAEIQRIDFAVTVVLVGQSGRHPIPQPRRPDHKSLQAEATTCRTPGA